MTDVALVVTTIKVPLALEWYRACGPDVPFYVIGDDGAPDDDIKAFCDTVDARYYSASTQRMLGYACSDLLRWRDPARRSIGCLEAARDGAEIIIMADDDNLPLDRAYFVAHRLAFGRPFGGLTLEPHGSGYTDPWQLLQPPVHHRGFPHQLWNALPPPKLGYATGLRVGVNAGAVLGDPDIDAAERIVSHPTVISASPVLNAGVALSPMALAPFNAQNTAFHRDLLPLMCMLSPAGRCLDIWAAYLAETVMGRTGWAVRYGQPYVWQQRNYHDLAADTRAEQRGAEETLQFVAAVKDAPMLKDADVSEAAWAVHSHLATTRWADVAELGQAWLKDCAGILG